MTNKLKAKLVALHLIGCALTGMTLYWFAINRLDALALPGKADALNFVTGIAVVAYFALAIRAILKDKLPAWLEFLVRRNWYRAGAGISAAAIFAGINLLYLAYYPPFGRRFDLSILQIFAPMTFFLLLLIFFAGSAAATYVHQTQPRAVGGFILRGFRLFAIFLCCEQIFNIIVANIAW